MLLSRGRRPGRGRRSAAPAFVGCICGLDSGAPTQRARRARPTWNFAAIQRSLKKEAWVPLSNEGKSAAGGHFHARRNQRFHCLATRSGAPARGPGPPRPVGCICGLGPEPPRRSTTHSRQPTHSRNCPIMPTRPAFVRTHGRTCHGGSWRMCWAWPHSSSATQCPSTSW